MTGSTLDILKRWGRCRTARYTGLYRLAEHTSLAMQLSANRRGQSRPEAAGADKSKALERLPEPFRTILALIDVNGLSMREAASVMGCEPAAFCWKVIEGRRQLYSVMAAGRTSQDRGEA